MFTLSPEYEELRRSVQDFAGRYHNAHESPPDFHRRIRDFSEAGLYERMFPPEYGGTLEGEYDILALSLIREALAYHGSYLDNAFISQGLGGYPIYRFGNDEQKEQYLPPIAAGELLPSFAITEPKAGSDVAGMNTRAEHRNGHYVLNGKKKFISYAMSADILVVFAKTKLGSGEERDEISAFIVDADSPGIERKPHEVIVEHNMANLVFRDVEVPEENRIGEEGEGMSIALGNLEIFRTTVGGAAVGMAQAALDASVERLNKRKQFGKPLKKFQGLQFKVADMATKTRAARLMVYSAATAKNNQPDAREESSMAKLFATEKAFEVINEAVQIFGGDGVSKGTRVEQLYREIRPLLIYEGTSEIQRIVISREVL